LFDDVFLEFAEGVLLVACTKREAEDGALYALGIGTGDLLIKVVFLLFV
jgi:hypothetical protein